MEVVAGVEKQKIWEVCALAGGGVLVLFGSVGPKKSPHLAA